MQVMARIGDRLKELRGRRILTQRELQELSGVHYTTIAKLEQNHAEARPSTIRKLAAALGVTPEYLAGVEDQP